MQIKKNDNVLVTAGKETGKRGRVIAVYRARTPRPRVQALLVAERAWGFGPRPRR